MGREETVRRSVQELERVHVIRHAMNTALRQREAGEVLGVTARQVRRLIRGFRPKATRASCLGDGGSCQTDGIGPR